MLLPRGEAWYYTVVCGALTDGHDDYSVHFMVAIFDGRTEIAPTEDMHGGGPLEVPVSNGP